MVVMGMTIIDDDDDVVVCDDNSKLFLFRT